MPTLGVNIDHVASLRQARRDYDPDPIMAAQLCEKSGARSIVAHLREDRRHIQDRDIYLLRKVVTTKFNLEMSLAPSIVDIALDLSPHQVTIVPERRQEVTTEGGLDVGAHMSRIEKVLKRMSSKGILVSLFIDPQKKQIDAAHRLGVPMVEFHTGPYARAFAQNEGTKHIQQLSMLTTYARQLGLVVHLGHGLNYDNTALVARIPGIEELNIGHAIISRAVFVGLSKAVKDMVALMT